MSIVWETKPRKGPQQTSGLLVGLEQGTRLKTLPDISMMMKRMMTTTLVALKTQASCDMTAMSLGKQFLILSVLLHPEDAGTMIHQNNRNHLHSDTA